MWTFFWPDDVAAEVLVEVDGLLIDHAQVARSGRRRGRTPRGCGCGRRRASRRRRRASGIRARRRSAKTAVPVERVFEVAHGAVGGALGVSLVGQDHGGRNGDAELFGQGVVEELVVGRPPEGVVDDDGAVERGVLEEGAVEGDVVGDAVDDDGVARRACPGGRRRFRRIPPGCLRRCAR